MHNDLAAPFNEAESLNTSRGYFDRVATHPVSNFISGFVYAAASAVVMAQALPAAFEQTGYLSLVTGTLSDAWQFWVNGAGLALGAGMFVVYFISRLGAIMDANRNKHYDFSQVFSHIYKHIGSLVCHPSVPEGDNLGRLQNGWEQSFNTSNNNIEVKKNLATGDLSESQTLSLQWWSFSLLSAACSSVAVMLVFGGGMGILGASGLALVAPERISALWFRSQSIIPAVFGMFAGLKCFSSFQTARTTVDAALVAKHSPKHPVLKVLGMLNGLGYGGRGYFSIRVFFMYTFWVALGPKYAGAHPMRLSVCNFMLALLLNSFAPVVTGYITRTARAMEHYENERSTNNPFLIMGKQFLAMPARGDSTCRNVFAVVAAVCFKLAAVVFTLGMMMATPQLFYTVAVDVGNLVELMSGVNPVSEYRLAQQVIAGLSVLLSVPKVQLDVVHYNVLRTVSSFNRQLGTQGSNTADYAAVPQTEEDPEVASDTSAARV